MARGRMLNRTVCASLKFQQLSDDTCRLLATWLLPHLDLNGVFYGDAAMVKSAVFPRRADISAEMIAHYLDEIEETGLICRFEAQGDLWLWWPGFEDNQAGLRRERERTSYPEPPRQAYEPEPAAIRQAAGDVPAAIRQEADQKPGESNLIQSNLKEVKGEEKRREEKAGPPPPAAEETARSPPDALSTVTMEEIRTPDDDVLRLRHMWPAFQREMRLQMGNAVYAQWIADLMPVKVEGDQVVLSTASHYVSEWCRSRLKTPIERTLAGVLGRQVEVSYVVVEG